MPTEDLIAAVLAHRAEAWERLLASKAAQDVRRFEAAYVALTGKGHPDFIFHGDEDATATEVKTTRRGNSVRALIEMLLTVEPREWSYDDLGDALEAEGHKVRDDQGKLKSSVRTAAWTLVNEGVAARGPSNTVYATKFADELDHGFFGRQPSLVDPHDAERG